MPSINQCMLFLSLALCASALATPYDVRHVNHHRSVAARVATPQEPAIASGGQTLRRRRINSRCNKTPSSEPAAAADNSTSTSTTTTSKASKSTPVVSTNLGVKLPSFLQGTQTGEGTFYGTGLGACGITNNDNQHIAAVSHLLFDSFPGYQGGNPNNNPVCGKQVTAHYQGKSVTVTITDRCAACALTDLDFSPAAFDTLADPNVGRITGMTWSWD
jgi:hypothetical protein